ncbi:MAG: hypothetical protein HYV63_18700 [Candidatus Schekmanbacteria bacterium]|nr:hypothetical protein [Candidatus Schekmanbacteria bacterium]
MRRKYGSESEGARRTPAAVAAIMLAAMAMMTGGLAGKATAQPAPTQPTNPQPPATQPPATQPPAPTQPASAEPTGAQPPATQPPAATPPAPAQAAPTQPASTPPASTPPAATQPVAAAVAPRPTQGTLTCTKEGRVIELAPMHTKAAATIEKQRVQVELVQSFSIPPDATEGPVGYLYPLPLSAAVTALGLKAGDKALTADKTDLGSTGKTGLTSNLLGRRSLFVRRFSGAKPGDTVNVVFKYEEPVTPGERRPDWLLPLTAWTAVSAGAAGAPGDAIPADRPASEVELEVKVATGKNLAGIICVSHPIVFVTTGPEGDVEAPALTFPFKGTATIRLAKGDKIPNRDFLVQWRFVDPVAEKASLPPRPPFAVADPAATESGWGLRVDALKITGKISDAQFLRVLYANENALSRLLDAVAAGGKLEAGDLVVVLSAAGDGAVGEVDVRRGSLKDSALAAALASHLKRWTLPASHALRPIQVQLSLQAFR